MLEAAIHTQPSPSCVCPPPPKKKNNIKPPYYFFSNKFPMWGKEKKKKKRQAGDLRAEAALPPVWLPAHPESGDTSSPPSIPGKASPPPPLWAFGKEEKKEGEKKKNTKTHHQTEPRHQIARRNLTFLVAPTERKRDKSY